MWRKYSRPPPRDSPIGYHAHLRLQTHVEPALALWMATNVATPMPTTQICLLRPYGAFLQLPTLAPSRRGFFPAVRSPPPLRQTAPRRLRLAIPTLVNDPRRLTQRDLRLRPAAASRPVGRDGGFEVVDPSDL